MRWESTSLHQRMRSGAKVSLCGRLDEDGQLNVVQGVALLTDIVSQTPKERINRQASTSPSLSLTVIPNRPVFRNLRSPSPDSVLHRETGRPPVRPIRTAGARITRQAPDVWGRGNSKDVPIVSRPLAVSPGEG